MGNLNSFSDSNLFAGYNITAKRDSQDKVVNRGGRDLVKYMGEKGLFILNGRAQRDSPGKLTFVGTMGSSMIDHVWVGYDFLELLEALRFSASPNARIIFL